MLDILWGLKSTALFDVWSIEHVLSGVSVGAAVIRTNKEQFKKIFKVITEFEQKAVKSLHFDVVGVLLVAYAWESVEHYLEMGIAGGAVEFWLQGVEMWGNRLITDPLMLVAGYMIAKKYPQLVIPARVMSIVWLITHVFIFPHSMYLHELMASL